MKLYNTLTRKTEEVTPLNDKKISIYTCGLTVYSQPHIGNWVGYIYWDVLVRTLTHSGYEVIRTQNYTDVGHLTSDDDNGEDKMEKGAKAEGITAWDVANKYIAIADHEAYDLLKLQRPTYLVRATDYIPQQIAFVQKLETKGFTYVIPEDGVYFDTSKLTDYGKLAKLDIDGLKAGARVPVEGKKNITDFAVWKFSHKGKKRDMEWESPWGTGFPGWHLECSVIAQETLGDQIDIHAGGVDHIPVHHTNEIAQTEAVTGKQFATYWIHNNHIKIDGGKMSKSLGNIYTLQDIQSRGIDLMAFKLMVLQKHFRTEGNFTWEILESAQNRLNNLRDFADMRFQIQTSDSVIQKTRKWFFDDPRQKILDALNDSLDTPKALALVSDAELTLLGLIGRTLHPSNKQDFSDFIGFLDAIFGLDLSASKDITSTQKKLITDRQVARANNDYTTSDRIRDELKEQGIKLNDPKPNATSVLTTWARIR